MNKMLVSGVAGAVIGAVVTLVIVFVFGVGLPVLQGDIMWFEQPGNCITKENLRVLEMVAPNKALVGEEKDDLLNNPLMLLVTPNDANFYDEQIISMPKGKCARHQGNFNLQTKDDGIKIVPVVTIE